MSVFASVRDMRARLGLPNQDDVNDAIEQVLLDATESLKADLRTDFARNTVADTFFVQSTLEYGGSVVRWGGGNVKPSTTAGAREAKLLLSRGFVDSAGADTIVASSTRLGLDDTALQTDLQDTESKNFTSYDYEKGYLRVTDFSLSRCYVRATYVAGFTTDGATPEVYVVPAAQQWLVQAAKIKAQIIASDNPLLSRDPDDRADSQRKRLSNQYARIVLDRARYLPMRQGRITDTVLTAAP